MKRGWLLLVAAVCLLTQTAFDIRRIARDVNNDNAAVDRFVDISVTLKVVRSDPAGEVLIEGARPMSVLRTYNLGGVLDTKATPPRILSVNEDPAPNPVTWYCSEDQERVILHDDTEPTGKLALGGMGAGKTTAGTIWLYLRWLEEIEARIVAAKKARERDPNAAIPPPNEIGITSPTETRLSLVFNELFGMWPSSWWRFNSENKIATLADGFRLRGVSTHRQSASQGSRIQAFNWVHLFSDELQDCIEEFIHMQARLRANKTGRAKWYAPATAKDLPEWRTLQSAMMESGDWMLHQLLGPSSPFVSPDHWARMMRSMTESDYKRLVLAEDVPSESRVYSTFDRKHNLKPIPFGAKKITSIVLSRKTNNRQDALLLGHDPGAAKAGTVWLDAYQLSRQQADEIEAPYGEPVWFVRAELFTLHAGDEAHALKAMDITRKQFGCNVRPDAERAHVRCQPLGAAEDKPDLSTFAIWRRIGFEIKAAQYSKTGQGIGQIKKDSRIGVVKTLFRNAYGKRRLFLECDERGRPLTPQLLSALETMERDEKGRAEHEEKNVKHDKSDLPAAMGYALYPFEKELASVLRDETRKALG